MALTELYQARILEHNRAPHNHFELSDATHSARGLDALCGDDIHVWLKVEGGFIREASWSGEACAITTASASMLSDWLPGRTEDEIKRGYQQFRRVLDDPEAPDEPALRDINLLRAVGRFPARKRNALLPWDTAVEALEQGRIE